MTALSADFEAGTAGTTLTLANTGFDEFSVGATSSATFDTVRAHGQLSAHLTWTATEGDYLSWTTQLGSPAQVYARAMIRFAALPGGELQVIRGFTTGGGAFRLVIDTTGTIFVRNGSNSVMAGSQMSTVLTPGSWWRIEAHAASGSIEVRLYANDATTPTETIGPLSDPAIVTPITELRFGNSSPSSGSAAGEMHLDDISASDVDWAGPVDLAPPAGGFTGWGMPL